MGFKPVGQDLLTSPKPLLSLTEIRPGKKHEDPTGKSDKTWQLILARVAQKGVKRTFRPIPQRP